MKWQQNNTITHSATASPSTSARRATHPRSHPLDPAPLPSFPLSLTLSRHPGHAGIPWRGKRGGKKKEGRRRREDWLADRLVTSLFRDPERTARAGIHFVDRNHYPPLPPPFSFPFHQVFLSVFFSPTPLPSRA